MSETSSTGSGNPVAIVTGGLGEGIGHGITQALLRHSWSVLVVDVDGERSETFRQSCSAEESALEILIKDITSPDAAGQAVSMALSRFGRLDGLVNGAGVGLCKPLAEITDEEFDHLVDVDLRAAFRFTRAAIPAMLEAGGAIVNIGSVHAHKTIPGYSVYAGIKAAIEGLTRGIAVDYGAHGIRANCIHPGLVASPQNDALIKQFHPDPAEWLANYTATKQLIPDLVTARQIGEMAAWLLGEHSATITGQAITVDGGSTVMLYERSRGL